MLVPKIDISTKYVREEEDDVVVVESINVKEDFLDIENVSPKRIEKFIKYIERIIRTSMEYRTYIGFLRNELNLTRCTFLPQIDTEEIRGVSLEFHHYPFTLYDIVNIVIQNRLIKGEKRIDPFQVADEVMYLHYQNMIGLVPVTKTIHELIHSSKLFVPLKYVKGSYKKFLSKYKWDMYDGYKEKMDNLKMLSEKIERGELNDTTGVLNKQRINVHIADIDAPEPIKVDVREYA